MSENIAVKLTGCHVYDGQSTYKVGDVVELAEPIAKQLIESGQAMADSPYAAGIDSPDEELLKLLNGNVDTVVKSINTSAFVENELRELLEWETGEQNRKGVIAAISKQLSDLGE